MKYTVSLLIAAVIVIAVIVCINMFSNFDSQTAARADSTSTMTSSAESVTTAENGTGSEAAATSAAAEISTVTVSETLAVSSDALVTAQTAASASETSSGKSVPESGAVTETDAVSDSYFDNTLFIGHSLMEGFRLYSGITSVSSAAFCAETSASVVSVLKDSDGTLGSALSAETYDQIYVMLGINEVGGSAKSFYQNFSALIDVIRSAQPDAVIYLISITPTTVSKEGTSFNNNNIKNFNASMLSVAEDCECYYIDLFSFFVGADGYLPEADSSDGVHLVASRYKDMLTYLKTHIVP